MKRMGIYTVSYSQGSALYEGLVQPEVNKYPIDGLTVTILERPRILSLAS